MQGHARLALFAVLPLAFALGCAGTRQTREIPAESGFLSDYSKLAPGGDDQAQLVYLKPGLDVSSYHAVRVEPVKLLAAAQDSDLAKLSREDQQMLANRLHTAIVDALAKDWKVVDQAGPGVLLVRGALTEAGASNVALDIVATWIPQVRLLSTVVGLGADTAATVGKARGEVEVEDGATGEQLMAAIDERVGTRGVKGVTDKWSDVQMAFDDWAERIRLRLAEHRGPPRPQHAN
jgi:hypothetical protein